jgi:predicted nucleotidyltransferase
MSSKNDLTKIKTIVEKYAKELNKKFDIKDIYIFGSYSKNNFNEDSDIDVLVISDDFTGDLMDDMLDLMRIRRKIDLRIEPHPLRSEDFTEDNPFIKSIKKDLLKIVA